MHGGTQPTPVVDSLVPEWTRADATQNFGTMSFNESRPFFWLVSTWDSSTLWGQTGQLILDLFNYPHIFLKIVDILLHVYQRTPELAH